MIVSLLQTQRPLDTNGADTMKPTRTAEVTAHLIAERVQALKGLGWCSRYIDHHTTTAVAHLRAGNIKLALKYRANVRYWWAAAMRRSARLAHMERSLGIR